MTSRIDPSTLGWVKAEIDETLRQARLALESYVENDSDETRLRFCVTYLHQVVGTLKMVELDGPAMLAEEIERLAEAILEGKVKAEAPILDLLSRTILTLPDYLGRLQFGQPDVPVRLLPLLNELRVARAAVAFSEADLFNPDLSVRPPVGEKHRLDDAGFVDAVKKARPGFQAELLKWLRNPEGQAHLSAMTGIVDELAADAAPGPAEQMLWVAGALMVAFATGDVEPTNDRKKLLSRLDQQLKKLADGTPKNELRVSVEAVTKGILFELAHAQSQEPRVQQVKQAFELDQLVQGQEDEAQLPSPDALQSVAAALGKEIESAQDMMATYFSAHEPDPRGLELLCELLKKMSGTLEMLGVDALKALVDELNETASAVMRGDVERSERVAMQMASGLLMVENSAREIAQSGAAWKKQIDDQIDVLRALRTTGDDLSVAGIEISDAALTDGEFKQLLSVVAGEIRVNLAKVEEALEAFAGQPESHAHLQSVPQHLSQIQGALQILGQDRAAEMTAYTNERVQDIIDRRVIPGRAMLDALAVAVGTVEAYIDGLERDRPHLDSLIEVALHDVKTAELEAPAGIAPVPAVSGERSEAVDSSPEGDESNGNDMQDREADMRDEHPQSSDVPRSAPTPRPTEKPGSPAGTGIPDLDLEIMEIFVEDAKEMLQVIDNTLGKWQDNIEDRESLAELRRAFHTLKGSGRMVGASEIAELAWSVESLLNRVRENKVAPSDAMFTLLHETRAILPRLIGKLEGHDASDADTAPLRARAEELADTQPPAAAAANPPPVIDPTLLQIFTGETRAHLATVGTFLATPSPRYVSADILRAAHTLQGSSRSVGLIWMAEACSEMEKFLQAVEIRQLPLADSACDMLQQVHDRVGDLLRVLNANQPPNAVTQEAFIRLGRAFHAAIAQMSAPAAKPAVEPTAPPKPDPAPAARVERAPERPRVSEPIAVTPDVDAPLAEAASEIEEEIDPELLEIFHEEAVDILEALESALTNWRANRGDRTAVHDLKRQLHTLKGGARMAGAMTIGNVAHNTESLLRQVEEGKTVASAELLDLFDEVHDGLVVMIERLHARRPLPASANELNTKLNAWLAGSPVAASVAPVGVPESTAAVPAPVAAAPIPESETPTEAPAVAALASAPTNIDEDEDDADSVSERPERREQIKVRTALLNDLVNYAGEVSIARSRMEQQIFGFREHLAELGGNVSRFRTQLRELEIQSESQILYRAEQTAAAGMDSDFDPLEFDRFSKLQHLSRALTESLHDLSTIQTTLDNFASQAELVLQHQARVNTELQEGLMRTRMIGFSTQAGRLRHLVRQTARELGKRAELEIVGSDVEVDRTVLERMVGPFEHMIRNSLDHGIESEADRRRLGKPAMGKITIATSHEGSEIVLRFSDDGAGLDVRAIRRKAIDRGLMQSDSGLSDDEVMQFILLPGFSTAKKITHLSGRGVGMDVVHNEVKQLGGSITVDTRAGVGTTFVIRLPLTLSITQALTVYVGEQRFAVPLSSIANILEVPADKLNSISMGEKPLFNYEDQLYPFMHLGARLGIPSSPQSLKKVPVLLIKSGTREIALQIDGLGGTQEAVIKSLGPQISALKGIAGATILGDGSVVLILDIPGLWITDEALHVEHGVYEQIAAAPEQQRAPLIMVVDDSLTVRKVTSRHLQKRGMDVLVAKDGLDALEQLREQVPDVMLVDIEMPRMDGYELTANVRSDSRLRDVPIIMITSRAGSKHRDRAMQLGVNIYMSKPYQEDELAANIEAMLQRRRLH